MASDPTPDPQTPEVDEATPLPEPLRAKLRTARTTAKLSQAELGRRLGISGTQVYRIEAGQRGSRPSTIQSWLVECGWSVNYVESSIPS